MTPCRCGYTGDGPHPCHGQAYTCGRPAERRYYSTGTPFSLAGMQMKASVVETWACDDCWAAYRKEGEGRG